MKIFDCTTFYNESLMLEVRFNILNKYVDKFIVVEAKYSHSGEKKKLNFDIKKFKEFKKKIIYLVSENEPNDLIYKMRNNIPYEEENDMRLNSIKRIAHQRNKLIDGLNDADDNDYILYSDNDEIPDLKNLNFEKFKDKILIFNQELFYYKFNLFCDRIDWFGTKACTKKNLKSFSWLREIKPKKYPFFRIDTLSSETKYMNIEKINNGGWHFSQLKTPKDIEIKLLNGEQHGEYKSAKKDLRSIDDLVKRKVIDYDHKAKTSDYKYSKEFKLQTVSLDRMPKFLRDNVNKYSEWFDNDEVER
jgi:beta-1,4-mannosyl-glycoprotein beta-1,4-N-acetylglucosaminyltransferase